MTVLCGAIAFVCLEAANQINPRKKPVKVKKKRKPLITFEGCINYALAFAVCLGMAFIQIYKILEVQNGQL